MADHFGSTVGEQVKIHFGVVGIAYLNRSAEIVLDLVGGDNPQDIGIGLLASCKGRRQKRQSEYK
jgi:hypothetical protein